METKEKTSNRDKTSEDKISEIKDKLLEELKTLESEYNMDMTDVILAINKSCSKKSSAHRERRYNEETKKRFAAMLK